MKKKEDQINIRVTSEQKAEMNAYAKENKTSVAAIICSHFKAIINTKVTN